MEYYFFRCGELAYTNLKGVIAFEKFHSSWITNTLVAMQRPSDELIENLKLIDQFKSAGITAIFNLTEPGEHPYCGYGIKASGFPYTPDVFMNAGSK